MIIDKNISLLFLKIARCSRSELVFTFLLSTSPCSYIKVAEHSFAGGQR